MGLEDLRDGYSMKLDDLTNKCPPPAFRQVNLDGYCNLPGLLNLHEDICEGIAYSEIEIGTTGGAHTAKGKELGGVLKEWTAGTNRYQDRIDRMTQVQRKRFLSFVEPTITVGQVILLRKHKDSQTKCYHEHTSLTSSGERFPFLFKWLDEQKIFQDYGRVVLYATTPGFAVPVHRDRIWPRFNEFIWFRTRLDKKMFMTDLKGGKEYVDSHILWFDDRVYHGAEANDHYTFSFKVDGVFSDSFRDYIFGPLLGQHDINNA
jgi:hypothetical protein